MPDLSGISTRVTPPEETNDTGSSSIKKSRESKRNVERPYDDNHRASFFGYREDKFLHFFEEESAKYPSIADLQKAIFRDPQEFVIKYLRKVSPFAGKVINVTLDTAFGEGDIEIAVYDKKGNYIEADASELAKLFKTQPPDVGDLHAISTKLLLDFMYFGKGCCFEGVTSEKRLGGYSNLYPFSSRSLLYGQLDKESDFAFYQEQLDLESGSTVKKELNPNHIYWSPNQPTIENPFGTSAISSAGLEALGEAIMRRDLKDGIQNAGNPTHTFKYDSGELHATAVEKLRYKGNQIAEYVKRQIDTLREYARKYRATDNVVVDTATQFERIPAGDFRGLESAIQLVWTALSASLNAFPAMLGFGDVSKTNINYQFFAMNVKSSRSHVKKLLERFCEQHFLLKGKVRKVVINYPTIHTTDEIAVENTRQVRIANESKIFLMGLSTEDEFAVALTGRKAVRPVDKEAVREVLSITPTDKNNSKQSGGNNPNEVGGGVQGKPKPADGGKV